MLTPEQIQAARMKYGISSKPTPPTGNTPVITDFDEWKRGMLGEPAVPVEPEGPPPGALDVAKQGFKTLGQVGIGAGKRFLQTGADTGALLAKVATKLTGQEPIPEFVEPIPELERKGMPQKVGAGIEQVAEFLIPFEKAIGAVGKGAELVTKGKKIAPFAKQYLPEVAKIAQELGIELPASSLTKSKAAQMIETIGAKGIFGGKIGETVERAGQQLHTVADEIVKRTAGTTNPTEAGNLIVKGMEKFKEGFINTKQALYGTIKFPTEGAEIIKMKPTETLKLLNSVIEKKKGAAQVLGGAKDLQFFQKIKNGLSKDVVNAEHVRDALTELGERMKNFNDPIVTGNKATLQKLSATMQDEFEQQLVKTSPELAKKLATANAFFKRGLAKLQTKEAETIAQLKDSPAQLVETLIKPHSVDRITKLFEIVGPEAKPAIQSTFLDKLFSASRTPEGTVSGTKITQFLNKYGDETVRAVIGDKKFEAIKKIETMGKALQAGQKVASGSQTAFITRLITQGGLLYANPILGIKAMLGDAVFSKFISSESGKALLGPGMELKGGIGKFIQRAAPVLSKILSGAKGLLEVRQKD